MYVLHSLNGTIYTLLCSFFAVFAVWLVCALKELQATKHHAQMYTESEYSQLAQLDSGLVLPCIATIVHLLYEQWTPNIYLLALSRIIKNRTEFRTQMVAENGNILI